MVLLPSKKKNVANRSRAMLDDVIVGGMKGVFLYPASKKKTFFLQHMTKYEETKTVKKFRHDPLVL